MGLGGISIWQLIILLVIVLLVFGSKRLRNLGPDLGHAFKGFRSAVKDVENGREEESDQDSKAGDHVEYSERGNGTSSDSARDREASRKNDQ